MRVVLTLALLSVFGANAFTFTCEQVKKLISDKTVFSTDNACVSLDEFLSTNHGIATELYFEDSSGKGKWSFAETAEVGCVSLFSSLGQWKIVTDRADGGEGIDCTNQFTVFFSSIESVLVTAKNEGMHHQSYRAYNFTVVAPRGGMLIDFSCNNTKEPLNFYTGLGNGANEEMFYYGSSLCDEKLSVFAWDTAVTINVPNDGYIMLTYFRTGAYLSLGSVSYDFILLGSGKSNAIVQHGEDDKFVWLSPTISVDLKFHVDGVAQFDSKHGNSLVLSAQCKQNDCTDTKASIPAGDVHLILEADFLAINYYTHVSDDQWKDNDLFFLRMATTPLNTSEPPPTVPPPKPNTVYNPGCSLVNGNASFAPSLWIDVVFIVDVSKAMGTAGIDKATSMIDSIVNSMTIGNDLSVTPQKFSRVAIVAVSDKAEIINDLTSPVKSPLKLSPSNSAEADIGSGIAVALDQFARHSRSTRPVIYIIASSDSSHTDNPFGQPRVIKTYDATLPAEKFKSEGGIIAITDADPSHTVGSFNKLASAGYYNVGFNSNVNLDLQLLCDANCFCSSHWTEYSIPNFQRESANGGCYNTLSSTNPYALAKEACQSEGGLISTIHDSDKQIFLLELISQFGANQKYWIGNEYNGQNWEWIDDNNSTYSNWVSGQPDSSIGRCAYSQQTVGFNSGWFAEDCSDDHLYICQRPPCTVDNYCA